MILWLFFHNNEISYTGKTASLCWIGVLVGPGEEIVNSHTASGYWNQIYIFRVFIDYRPD